MARGGDTIFKMTTGFLGLATAGTGIYLVASMIGAYASAKVSQSSPEYILTQYEHSAAAYSACQVSSGCTEAALNQRQC